MGSCCSRGDSGSGLSSCASSGYSQSGSSFARSLFRQ